MIEQKSAGKLAGQYVDQDVDEPKKKRSRVVKTDRPSVMSQFRGVDSATVIKAMIFGFYIIFINSFALFGNLGMSGKRFFVRENFLLIWDNTSV